MSEFGERHCELGTGLERNLIPLAYAWHWRLGGELPVEAFLAQRHHRFRNDPDLLLVLIGIEMEHAPNEPEKTAYRERFPALAEEIGLHFRVIRELNQKWTTPPSVVLGAEVDLDATASRPPLVRPGLAAGWLRRRLML